MSTLQRRSGARIAGHSCKSRSVITWSKAMGEFGAVLMLAGATTMRTETLPIALYLNISTGDVDLAVAAATILILISLAALCCAEYLDRNINVF